MSYVARLHVAVGLLLALYAVTRSPPVRAGTAQQPDTTRIAIAISGAASLGSFEGGALAEIVRQLEIYNRAHPEHVYSVDVLTGTSAGALSALVLARELYSPPYDVTRSDYPESSLHYQAWVTDIDLMHLLPRDWPDADKSPFFLQSDAIGRIAESVLGKELPTAGSTSPLTLSPDTLVFGLTLANMEGLHYELQFQNQTLPVRFYHDERTFALTDGGSRLTFFRARNTTARWWDDAVLTAFASAAVPFAFPPVRLERHPDEFEHPPLNLTEKGFQYVDGGYFDNDPIHMAQRLARSRDAYSGNYQRDRRKPRRHLLAIAPDFHTFVAFEESLSSTIDYTRPDPAPPDGLKQFTGNMFIMGERSLRSSGFRTYLANHRRNQERVGRLATTLYDLGDKRLLLRQMVYAVEVLDKLDIATGDMQILQRFVQLRPEHFVSDSLETVQYTPNLDAAVASRLSEREVTSEAVEAARWLLSNDAPQDAQQLFVDLFDIRGYEQPSDFYMITNDPCFRLLGAAHLRFAGLYSKAAREHDFYAGRYFAQRALADAFDMAIEDPISESDMKSFQKDFFRDNGPFESIRDYFLTADARSEARKRIEARAAAYVRYLDIPWWLRIPAMSAAQTWLDRNLVYMPQSVDMTFLAQWREVESVATGLQLDLMGPVFRVSDGLYDKWIRNGGMILQPFVASELGYKYGQYHYLDVTVAPQLGLYFSMDAPLRLQAEFGRRFTFNEFVQPTEKLWVAGAAVKWSFLYFSGKTIAATDDVQKLRFGADWDWRFGFVFNPLRFARTASLVF